MTETEPPIKQFEKLPDHENESIMSIFSDEVFSDGFMSEFEQKRAVEKFFGPKDIFLTCEKFEVIQCDTNGIVIHFTPQKEYLIHYGILGSVPPRRHTFTPPYRVELFKMNENHFKAHFDLTTNDYTIPSNPTMRHIYESQRNGHQTEMLLVHQGGIKMNVPPSLENIPFVRDVLLYPGKVWDALVNVK